MKNTGSSSTVSLTLLISLADYVLSSQSLQRSFAAHGSPTTAPRASVVSYCGYPAIQAPQAVTLLERYAVFFLPLATHPIAKLDSITASDLLIAMVLKSSRFFLPLGNIST